MTDKDANTSVDELYGDIDDMYTSQTTSDLPTSSQEDDIDGDTDVMDTGDDTVPSDLEPGNDLDLYDDLIVEQGNRDTQSYQEVCMKFEEAMKLIRDLEAQNETLRVAVNKQEASSKDLEKNFSSLLLTARGEIGRKDKELTVLRNKLHQPSTPGRNRNKQRGGTISETSLTSIDSTFEPMYVSSPTRGTGRQTTEQESSQSRNRNATKYFDKKRLEVPSRSADLHGSGRRRIERDSRRTNDLESSDSRERRHKYTESGANNSEKDCRKDYSRKDKHEQSNKKHSPSKRGDDKIRDEKISIFEYRNRRSKSGEKHENSKKHSEEFTSNDSDQRFERYVGKESEERNSSRFMETDSDTDTGKRNSNHDNRTLRNPHSIKSKVSVPLKNKTYENEERRNVVDNKRTNTDVTERIKSPKTGNGEKNNHNTPSKALDLREKLRLKRQQMESTKQLQVNISKCDESLSTTNSSMIENISTIIGQKVIEKSKPSKPASKGKTGNLDAAVLKERELLESLKSSAKLESKIATGKVKSIVSTGKPNVEGHKDIIPVTKGVANSRAVISYSDYDIASEASDIEAVEMKDRKNSIDTSKYTLHSMDEGSITDIPSIDINSCDDIDFPLETNKVSLQNFKADAPIQSVLVDSDVMENKMISEKMEVDKSGSEIDPTAVNTLACDKHESTDSENAKCRRRSARLVNKVNSFEKSMSNNNEVELNQDQDTEIFHNTRRTRSQTCTDSTDDVDESTVNTEMKKPSTRRRSSSENRKKPILRRVISETILSVTSVEKSDGVTYTVQANEENIDIDTTDDSCEEHVADLKAGKITDKTCQKANCTIKVSHLHPKSPNVKKINTCKETETNQNIQSVFDIPNKLKESKSQDGEQFLESFKKIKEKNEETMEIAAETSDSENDKEMSTSDSDSSYRESGSYSGTQSESDNEVLSDEREKLNKLEQQYDKYFEDGKVITKSTDRKCGTNGKDEMNHVNKEADNVVETVGLTLIDSGLKNGNETMKTITSDARTPCSADSMNANESSSKLENDIPIENARNKVIVESQEKSETVASPKDQTGAANDTVSKETDISIKDKAKSIECLESAEQGKGGQTEMETDTVNSEIDEMNRNISKVNVDESKIKDRHVSDGESNGSFGSNIVSEKTNSFSDTDESSFSDTDSESGSYSSSSSGSSHSSSSSESEDEDSVYDEDSTHVENCVGDKQVNKRVENYVGDKQVQTDEGEKPTDNCVGNKPKQVENCVGDKKIDNCVGDELFENAVVDKRVLIDVRPVQNGVHPISSQLPAVKKTDGIVHSASHVKSPKKISDENVNVEICSKIDSIQKLCSTETLVENLKTSESNSENTRDVKQQNDSVDQEEKDKTEKTGTEMCQKSEMKENIEVGNGITKQTAENKATHCSEEKINADNEAVNLKSDAVESKLGISTTDIDMNNTSDTTGKNVPIEFQSPKVSANVLNQSADRSPLLMLLLSAVQKELAQKDNKMEKQDVAVSLFDKGKENLKAENVQISEEIAMEVDEIIDSENKDTVANCAMAETGIQQNSTEDLSHLQKDSKVKKSISRHDENQTESNLTEMNKKPDMATEESIFGSTVSLSSSGSSHSSDCSTCSDSDSGSSSSGSSSYSGSNSSNSESDDEEHGKETPSHIIKRTTEKTNMLEVKKQSIKESLNCSSPKKVNISEKAKLESYSGKNRSENKPVENDGKVKNTEKDNSQKDSKDTNGKLHVVVKSKGTGKTDFINSKKEKPLTLMQKLEKSKNKTNEAGNGQTINESSTKGVSDNKIGKKASAADKNTQVLILDSPDKKRYIKMIVTPNSKNSPTKAITTTLKCTGSPPEEVSVDSNNPYMVDDEAPTFLAGEGSIPDSSVLSELLSDSPPKRPGRKKKIRHEPPDKTPSLDKKQCTLEAFFSAKGDVTNVEKNTEEKMNTDENVLMSEPVQIDEVQCNDSCSNSLQTWKIPKKGTGKIDKATKKGKAEKEMKHKNGVSDVDKNKICSAERKTNGQSVSGLNKASVGGTVNASQKAKQNLPKEQVNHTNDTKSKRSPNKPARNPLEKQGVVGKKVQDKTQTVKVSTDSLKTSMKSIEAKSSLMDQHRGTSQGKETVSNLSKDKHSSIKIIASAELLTKESTSVLRRSPRKQPACSLIVRGSKSNVEFTGGNEKRKTQKGLVSTLKETQSDTHLKISTRTSPRKKVANSGKETSENLQKNVSCVPNLKEPVKIVGKESGTMNKMSKTTTAKGGVNNSDSNSKGSVDECKLKLPTRKSPRKKFSGDKPGEKVKDPKDKNSTPVHIQNKDKQAEAKAKVNLFAGKQMRDTAKELTERIMKLKAEQLVMKKMLSDKEKHNSEKHQTLIRDKKAFASVSNTGSMNKAEMATFENKLFAYEKQVMKNKSGHPISGVKNRNVIVNKVENTVALKKKSENEKSAEVDSVNKSACLSVRRSPLKKFTIPKLKSGLTKCLQSQKSTSYSRDKKDEKPLRNSKDLSDRQKYTHESKKEREQMSKLVKEKNSHENLKSKTTKITSRNDEFYSSDSCSSLSSDDSSEDSNETTSEDEDNEDTDKLVKAIFGSSDSSGNSSKKSMTLTDLGITRSSEDTDEVIRDEKNEVKMRTDRSRGETGNVKEAHSDSQESRIKIKNISGTNKLNADMPERSKNTERQNKKMENHEHKGHKKISSVGDTKSSGKTPNKSTNYTSSTSRHKAKSPKKYSEKSVTSSLRKETELVTALDDEATDSQVEFGKKTVPQLKTEDINPRKDASVFQAKIESTTCKTEQRAEVALKSSVSTVGSKEVSENNKKGSPNEKLEVINRNKIEKEKVLITNSKSCDNFLLDENTMDCIDYDDDMVLDVTVTADSKENDDDEKSGDELSDNDESERIIEKRVYENRDIEEGEVTSDNSDDVDEFVMSKDGKEKLDVEEDANLCLELTPKKLSRQNVSDQNESCTKFSPIKFPKNFSMNSDCSESSYKCADRRCIHKTKYVFSEEKKVQSNRSDSDSQIDTPVRHRRQRRRSVSPTHSNERRKSRNKLESSRERGRRPRSRTLSPEPKRRKRRRSRSPNSPKRYRRSRSVTPPRSHGRRSRRGGKNILRHSRRETSDTESPRPRRSRRHSSDDRSPCVDRRHGRRQSGYYERDRKDSVSSCYDSDISGKDGKHARKDKSRDNNQSDSRRHSRTNYDDSRTITEVFDDNSSSDERYSRRKSKNLSTPGHSHHTRAGKELVTSRRIMGESDRRKRRRRSSDERRSRSMERKRRRSQSLSDCESDTNTVLHKKKYIRKQPGSSEKENL